MGGKGDRAFSSDFYGGFSGIVGGDRNINAQILTLLESAIAIARLVKE